MVNDRESQLYIDMADFRERIPKIEKELADLIKKVPNISELKSLKNRLGKLNNRIQGIELMAFQDQITRLTERIQTMELSLLILSRTVTYNEMDSLSLHMQDAIRLKYNNSDLKGRSIRNKLKEYISIELAKATEQNKQTDKPLDILNNFKRICVECSMKYDIRAFEDKP